MKTLKICRLIAAVLAEIFIVIAFVDMYRATEAGALLLLMVFFMSSVPFIYSESRKMGSRSELIRHITPGTLYGKMLFYAAIALVAMVAAFIDPEDMLPGLEMLAEYLGQTYRVLQRTHAKPNASIRYHTSSEDTILSHAIEYIRQNAANKITVSELAAFCLCSESYLSRIFKRRTGVNINVYINKVRVEQAKNNLILSHDSIADIALRVGFSDPNYFSRVFTQIIGISPTEFRRRFQQ